MDAYIKELEKRLEEIQAKFAEEIGAVRSGRPSTELIANLKVNYFDQMTPVNQLGTLTVVPPREVRITIWDKTAVAPVAKAIEDAKAGFSVAVDGNVLHANLATLSNERREELKKIAKKITEKFRIEVRGARDEAMKKLKGAEDRKEITEDDLKSGKDDVQKRVDEANAALERSLENKLQELSE